jgi:hypothetical protein
MSILNCCPTAPRLTRTILATGFLVVLAAGCSPRVGGSGHVITETRPISAANAVSLAGVGELTIVQGEPESLVIEAEDNIMPLIRTKVEGGRLEISEKDASPTKPIRFTLTIKDLTKIISTGAGTIRSAKFVSPGPLDFRVEGAGTVDFEQIECASVNVVLSGAGDVKLQGHTRNQDVELSGAAKYAAGDLRTHSAKVRISGAGNARVWATSDLDAEISGVGSVDYFGTPIIKKQISGVGDLHSLGDKTHE